jgi:hypothetical protein
VENMDFVSGKENRNILHIKKNVFLQRNLRHIYGIALPVAEIPN